LEKGRSAGTALRREYRQRDVGEGAAGAERRVLGVFIGETKALRVQLRLATCYPVARS
jgi:hypothetical protein